MEAKFKVQIIVPFGTSLTTEPTTDEQDDILCLDSDLEKADAEIIGFYPVQSSADAAPFLAAAEQLGFACCYENSKPHVEDEYAFVTIRFVGVSSGLIVHHTGKGE